MCKIKPFEHCDQCDGQTFTKEQVLKLLKKIAFNSRLADEMVYQVREIDIPEEFTI